MSASEPSKTPYPVADALPKRFTGRLIGQLGELSPVPTGPLAVLTAGSPCTSVYLCQLPDFAKFVDYHSEELSDDDIETLGATFIRFGANGKVPADNRVDLINFLDYHRREREAALPPAPPVPEPEASLSEAEAEAELDADADLELEGEEAQAGEAQAELQYVPLTPALSPA